MMAKWNVGSWMGTEPGKKKNIKCRNSQTSILTQLPESDSFLRLILQVGDCKGLLGVQREILKNTNMGGRGWGGRESAKNPPILPWT